MINFNIINNHIKTKFNNSNNYKFLLKNKLHN